MFQNRGRFRAPREEKSENSYQKRDLVNREDTSEFRVRQAIENDIIDSKYGFERVKDYHERTGFLLNMHSTEVIDEDKKLIAAVDYYFMEEDGTRFKITYCFMPYFFILTKPELIHEITQFLTKKYSGTIAKFETVNKEDLDLPNHLTGLKQKYIKLSFFNQSDLVKVRIDILKEVRKNKEKESSNTFYTEMLTNTLTDKAPDFHTKIGTNQMSNIIDIREYDVPYHQRVSTDLKLFCGIWYSIKPKANVTDPPVITPKPELIERPEPIVLAFDIETSKQELKFPDSAYDQIMMISYMIDGQGFLITNRTIISADIEDFEYTPKPEFEGQFHIFNEPNEEVMLRKFFDHILDVRPHIFVSYNGDLFDWPYIEARASVYNMNMKTEIGFFKLKEVYFCRPAIHMDCFCWVKRDSYLPVGYQNLKAVAKTKLRYDPVELDPEEMVPLAASQPQVLSNYSVSDAVATYYLYMQYVHPFIFALATIIPLEPDEVLRKGSGTLCEALLMVEAFHCNIVFPNKEETELNKMTVDGHILHQETYTGGHVEALESGVFRSDIPCHFRLEPSALAKLITEIPKTLQHAIEVEEGVPLAQVINFDEIHAEIAGKLDALKAQPLRQENPLIYHLDVGAMYPNIILTNRLQPCAIVDERICAGCDFNTPNATCRRDMEWESRVEFMPATRNEYHRIQQQLEMDKFPSLFKGGAQRAFHQLSKLEQAEYEKKRLNDYCRKVYKKVKLTRKEERVTTICQKENSFYVDTVRAFRDRRYEYKGMAKKAKAAVVEAVKGGDAAEIKSAKNREVLYDSLQTAHKCILNSFYGYVMRKSSRWYSMEMAGIVCYTGANIIKKTCEIIEKVGRSLELDTDGIWCILPASFPDNVTIHTTHEKKKKLIISYPNAVLNAMVKENFTNDQYHELINPKTLTYEQKSENTIFFEVDGPYRAMVLPAAKEEGKNLKKRYAVFNFDGSLAELKGFELKRRGELQLIKNFQSSVFDCFLKGDTLESCYGAAAQVADYWLDVLYSHGRTIPDSELFTLISENRAMSKALEEYGAQKSTSISTAKRLAEFLGENMVKDAGLACKYIIAKKPDAAPVTERAIPLAIFQASEDVQRHYLKKWLKVSGLATIDIRDILDWNYYIERLGRTIQKIITIPAAMQGVANPVPRVKHPDWLHKKMLEKNDSFKQRRITDMFSASEVREKFPDIEDIVRSKAKQPGVSKRKRSDKEDFGEDDLVKTWRDLLGNPPPFGTTEEEHTAWIKFHKRKWDFQYFQRHQGPKNKKTKSSLAVLRSAAPGTLGGFLQRAQQSLLTAHWQVIQIVATQTPGEYKLWALINAELHQVKLIIPRIFYANLKEPKDVEEGALFKKCNRTLPRSRQVHHLYMYSVPEEVFQEHGKKLYLDQSDPNVEGVYETQVPPLFRALVRIGCVCKVSPGISSLESFALDDLEITSTARQPYLDSDVLRHIYFYNHKHSSKPQEIYALFLTPARKALIIVVDSVRTNLMPNMHNVYQAERIQRVEKDGENAILPPDEINFEVRVETDLKQVYKLLQKAIQAYKDEKRGATLLAVQSTTEISSLVNKIPLFGDFPHSEIHNHDPDELYNVIDWQKVGAEALIAHYLTSERNLSLMAQQARYFQLPIGNIPADPALFASDLFYARHLIKHNHVLWCSSTDKPDLGGIQENDARLLVESQEGSSEVCNRAGWYSSVSVELDIDSLAINTLLQSHHVTDVEGTSAATAFDAAATVSLDDILGDHQMGIYDETARCAEAFKILRMMASTWMRDISHFKNVFADFQVVHFYRWLRSPTTLLFDPALLKNLQNLMKKLYLQLVAEFMQLGCHIIYANFNKIVICSRKKHVEDTLANIEFIVTEIRKKELFHSLEITYRQCWEHLVWMDPANFAGIQGKLPANLQEEPEHRGEEEDEDDEPVVRMNWNITERLPELGGCRNSFKAVIAGYINAIYWKLKATAAAKVTEEEEAVSSQPAVGLACSKDVLEYAKEILSGEITQKLLEITEKISIRFRAKQDGLDPALEFVKSVCHVLKLEPAIQETVDNLKATLLHLIGVGEFSEKAEWKDLSVSYVIPQVICKTCNHCRDIDLGRDQYRSENAWLCPLCDSAYNNAEMEMYLIDTISRKFLAYNLQDLQCKKCAQIKMENLIMHCHCAGQFKCLIQRSELIKLFETFNTLANTFEMVSLKETVEQSLLLIG